MLDSSRANSTAISDINNINKHYRILHCACCCAQQYEWILGNASELHFISRNKAEPLTSALLALNFLVPFFVLPNSGSIEALREKSSMVGLLR